MIAAAIQTIGRPMPAGGDTVTVQCGPTTLTLRPVDYRGTQVLWLPVRVSARDLRVGVAGVYGHPVALAANRALRDLYRVPDRAGRRYNPEVAVSEAAIDWWVPMTNGAHCHLTVQTPDGLRGVVTHFNRDPDAYRAWHNGHADDELVCRYNIPVPTDTAAYCDTDRVDL